MNTKTKKTYVAKFSNGMVVTRTSHKQYISATAYVNQETGKIKNVTFSSKPSSRPQKAGVFNNVASLIGYGSRKAFLRAIEENKQLEKVWKIETVEVGL